VAYDFPAQGLNIVIDDSTSRVYSVTATNPNFATAQGVRVGDSEFSMNAKLGPPKKKISDQGDTRYVYIGMIVNFIPSRQGVWTIVIKRL
jgi:hypothetical protein